MNKEPIQQAPDGLYLNRTPWFAFILLCCIFSLWAAAASMNDVLIAHFKKAFILSDFQTAFVQSAFYLGYFFLAIPAALMVRRFSYKTTILIGLALYMVGCSLFFPAAYMAKYEMFLLALFVIAAGLSFLETSSNTYSTLLGPKDGSTQRLNISQTFHPFGAITGVFVGSFAMFKETPADSSVSPLQHQLAMIQDTLVPYKWMIVVLMVIFVLIACTRYPSCKGVKHHTDEFSGVGDTLRRLWKNPRFTFGVLTQFLYVGAQVGVWSFTIRLAMQMGHMNERYASWFLMSTFAAYFAGKMIANFMMRRMPPARVLTIYSLLCIATLLYVILAPNISAVYAAVAVSVFLGPCWPTIYGLTIQGLGKDTAIGGSILVMSISGGGLVPLIQGLISDFSGGNMQLAYIVPMLCFIVIVLFGFYCQKRPIQASVEFMPVPAAE
ncbi:L-fucose:H+ symporter permease [Kozakia baliensis]|uniref:L-fucose:H+ symporter permease n=1 Tax=Kozakia baliensis TaxID=153496 RepID=UPI00345C0193